MDYRYLWLHVCESFQNLDETHRWRPEQWRQQPGERWALLWPLSLAWPLTLRSTLLLVGNLLNRQCVNNASKCTISRLGHVFFAWQQRPSLRNMKQGSTGYWQVVSCGTVTLTYLNTLFLTSCVRAAKGYPCAYGYDVYGVYGPQPHRHTAA